LTIKKQEAGKLQSIRKQGSKISVSFDFNNNDDLDDEINREFTPYNGRDFIKRNKFDVSTKGSLSLGRLKKFKENGTPN